MQIEPFTGLSLQDLAGLNFGDSVDVPNLENIAVLAIEESKLLEYQDRYTENAVLKLPQIPNTLFIMYVKK